MSRRSLIICLSVLFVMILGVGLAVAFLYVDGSDRDTSKQEPALSCERWTLMPAVPSDAVLVACLDSADGLDSLPLEDFRKARVAVSLHYSGKLVPLYVIETGKAGAEASESVKVLLSQLEDQGFVTEYVDCSTMDNGLISGSSVVIASKSDALVKSSMRHLLKGVSILDAPGFASAAGMVDSDDAVFFSNAHAARLFPTLMNGRTSALSSFAADFSDWTVFGLSAPSDSQPVFARGAAFHDGDTENFMTVFEQMPAGQSLMADVLPSYVFAATSLPMKDVETYMSAYQSYRNSNQALQTYQARQKELADKAGIKPVDFIQRLEVKEVVKASFLVAGKKESVNLLRVDNMDVPLVFKGTDITSLKGYVPKVHVWPYASFTASVFGDFFLLPDESCFTCIGDWIVTGSLASVQEYVDDKVLEYSLCDYLKDAGYENLISSRHVSYLSYVSLTEAFSPAYDIFRPGFRNILKPFVEGCDCAAAVVCAEKDRKNTVLTAEIRRFEPQKSKAPIFERDTVVVIPKGPFKVMNSGTGKENLFYQNAHLSLCLQQDGKDLWGIPFKKPICGTASTVDYYANGKLQFIFGAGSQIYLIDRLGRYVNGFPVDLGKEILLGPAVYDFNGTRKYNIMVLHKDKTIHMYNLKGQKPALWKGIQTDETIKSLPERIIVGGSSFWVVRTSIRTQIYPFYGGDPLTTFEGDRMIRPDSAIKVLDASTVEVTCYDGKTRTVKLK